MPRNNGWPIGNNNNMSKYKNNYFPNITIIRPTEKIKV